MTEDGSPAPGGSGETRPAAADDAGGLAVGTEFAGHRIEVEIGRGGMGVVYRARHLALDRDRALKLIAPALSADRRFRERFERESRLAARIEHPNVIPVHHAGEEGGRLYLTMRLVEGGDLQRLVESEGRLEAARAAAVISRVAAGLDAAHEHGLVHRDVKPANVLLEDDREEGERIFLTDFGISRLTAGGATITTEGQLLGSADYVAPEQLEGGPVDGRADVYSLGGVAHYALTGRPPFSRESELAKLYAHANAPRPRPSEAVRELSPAVDRVIGRAMAIRPSERYASAGEMARDLELALAGEATTDPLEPSSRVRAPAGRDRRRIGWLAAAVALAAAVVAAMLLAGGGDEREARGGDRPVSEPELAATARVGQGPLGVSVGEDFIWVASRDAREMFAIAPSGERQGRPPVPVDGEPTSVAIGFGSLWVALDGERRILRLDPAEGDLQRAISVGSDPSDVAVDDRWVWVANEGSDTVSRVDPLTNTADRTVHVGAEPRSIATGRGSVWVTNTGGGSVSEIDPEDARRVGDPIEVGQRPNDLAVGEGSVWVIDNFEGTLRRIDPDTGSVGEPIDVGAQPRGVKAGLGYVWVANGGDDQVVRVDPSSGEPVGDPVDVGDDPSDLAIGKGSVWVTEFGASGLARIDP